FALLRHPAEAVAGAPMRRNTRDVAAAPNDGAATDTGEAHDGEKERRLTDAVAPEHGKAAAVRHGERDAVEHDGVAVTGAHVVKREQRLSHGAPHRDRPRARARRRRFPWAYPAAESALRPSR